MECEMIEGILMGFFLILIGAVIWALFTWALGE